MTDRVDDRLDLPVAGGGQADRSPTVKVVVEHLEMQLVVTLAEHRPGAWLELLTGMQQRIPPLVVETSEEDALDATTARVAATNEPRRKHPGVVGHEEVARSQASGQIDDPPVSPDAAVPVEMEKTGLVAHGCRGLRDQVRGEVVVEVGG